MTQFSAASELLATSLEVALTATVIASVLGTALGSGLAIGRFRGREWVTAAVAIPLVLPPTVLGYYLLVVLGRQSSIGLAFHALTGCHLTFSRTGAILASCVAGLPMIARAAQASVAGIDPELVAAAQLAGASRWRTLFTIELPLARRGILAGISLAFARSLGDFGLTLMLGGNIPGETRTAALGVYDAIQAGRDNDALVLSASLTLLALAVLGLVARWEQRRYV